MDIARKTDRLDQIYNLFEGFAQNQDIACKRRCATCCTGNLTLTTLEGFKIISSLDASQKSSLLQSIRVASGQKRYQPKISINQMARICMQDGELPEEIADPNWGDCPLLVDRECPVYGLRPFGCRCMMSRTDCSLGGVADLDAFAVTVADLFNQFIEHLDAGGLSGNLIDVLSFLGNPDNLQVYRQGRTALAASGLIHNHPIPVLMIPPDHRLRAAPFVEALKSLVTDFPFRTAKMPI